MKDQPLPVTEIFLTRVSANNTEEYLEWVKKIREIESQFPGFRDVCLQPPIPGKSDYWITLLQFDSQEHLDNWMESKERKQVLEEANPLVDSLQNHCVTSPFASWFAKNTPQTNPPPVWKQSCLILLVLFPIVMIQSKYLMPLLLPHLALSPAIFISNVISVALIAWPLLPMAIWCLEWWLTPNSSFKCTSKGVLLLIALYALEIISLR